MTSPNSAGTLYADIVPDVTGFAAALRTKLGALTLPPVKVSAEPDVTRFNTALRDALTALPTVDHKVNIRPDLTGFNTNLRTALKALPAVGATVKVTVDVNNKAALSALRAVDALVRRLDGKTVNVRFTTPGAAATMATIARIQTAAAAASAIRVRIHIEVTGNLAALAAIATVAAAATALGAMNPTVNIGTGGAIGGMRLLIATAQVFGSAIVPAVAAGTAALASFAGVALSAGAGLGAGVLAISGVVGAVKALNDARNDAAKTGATLARQDKQLASGADQVKTAVAGLANAQAQAASQARQSANQVGDAERGLARAQRDSLRAQQDLTRAREDAVDTYEDLNSAVENNAIAAERANLQLADAEKALQAVKNDPATSRRRKEAELAYRDARQQVIDLTTRQGRLAEEQARAAKVGVDGSDQVVAAQERIRDTQERVSDAGRALSEARIAAAEQARQSAFSIAQAQQAVVAAQRTAATAAITTAATAGAAMDTLREKMDGLSPAGRRFAEFLVAQKALLVDLRGVAETGVLPGFQRGIEAILPYRGALTGFVGEVAAGLGNIAERGLRALTQPQWRPFFTYMGATAVPTMNRLAISAGNVALGLANIIVAFGPMQRNVGDGLIDLTEKFERWSAGLRTNRSFQDFIEYAATRGPVVLKTLGDLADTILHIAIAAAPVGDVVLTILSGIAAAINAIPIPVLTFLIAGLAALRIAAVVAPMVIALGAAMRAVATGSVTMSAAMSGTVSFLGGPWVVAIAAATVGIGLLLGAQAKARAEAKQLQNAMHGYGNTLKDGVNPESREHAQNVLRQNENLQKLLRVAKEAGVTQEDLVAGLNGDAAARGRVNDAINTEIARLQELQRVPAFQNTRSAEEIQATTRRIEKLKELQDAYNKASTAEERASIAAQFAATAQDDLADKARKVRDAMTGTTVTVDQYKGAIGALSGVAGDSTGKLGVLAAMAEQVGASNLTAAEQSEVFGSILTELGDSASVNGPQFDALAVAFTAIGDAALNARDKASLLQRAIDQMYGPSIRQTEAAEDLVRTQDSLAQRLQVSSAGFDLHTAASGKNRDEILQNRDALQAALQAARDKYVLDIASGVAVEDARAAHERATKTILLGIEPVQRNSAAVQELNTKYGQIPPVKKTDIQTPGLDEAIKEMVTAHSVQIGLSMKPPWTRDQIMAEVDFLQKQIDGRTGQSAIRKAAGGVIPGWSPTATADNVPVWATAGEFMQPVPTVQYYGVDAMEAIRQRRVPKELLMRGYAAGGLVDLSSFPVNIPQSVAFPARSADLWEQWERARVVAPAVSGGGVGSQRMMEILRATFPGLALYSGFRPGSRTASGSLSYHAFNRAVDLPPRHDVFRFIHDNYRAQTRELIWLGDYLRNIHNGRYHVYNKTLLSQHGVAGMPNAHIHWAMAQGGLVPNVGLPYLKRDTGGVIPPGLSLVDNSTGRDEWVFNDQQMRALAGDTATGATRNINIYPQRAEFDINDLRAEQARQDALDRVGRPF